MGYGRKTERDWQGMGSAGRRHDGGFTLLEVVIVVAVMGILVAVALPPFVNWRNTLGYRQTARGMTAMLREARSRAVTRNVQQMVVFKPNSSSYTMLQGSRAYNTPAPGWTPLEIQKPSRNVAIRSGNGAPPQANVSVQFNPNGTVRLADRNGGQSDGTITVSDGTAEQFQLTITPSGMITVKKK